MASNQISYSTPFVPWKSISDTMVTDGSVDVISEEPRWTLVNVRYSEGHSDHAIIFHDHGDSAVWESEFPSVDDPCIIEFWKLVVMLGLAPKAA